MAGIRSTTVRYRVPDGTSVSPRASARGGSLHLAQAMTPGSSVPHGLPRQSHLLFPEALSEPAPAAVRRVPWLRIARYAAYAVGGLLAAVGLVVAYLLLAPAASSGKRSAAPPAAGFAAPVTP